MAEELRELKVGNVVKMELQRHPLMEVTRVHLESLLPDQIKRTEECFTEEGDLDENKTGEYVAEAVDAHLRYLEALDRERTHGVARYQVQSETVGAVTNGHVSQNPLEAGFEQFLGYNTEQAKSAFGGY